MAQSTTCRSLRCRTVSEGAWSECPACGGPVLTSGKMRALGFVLLLCGIGMIALLWGEDNRISEMLAPSGPGEAEADFDWFLIGGALALVVNGLWMMATGRRSIPLFVPALLFLAVIAVLMVYIWLTLEPPPEKIYRTY